MNETTTSVKKKILTSTKSSNARDTPCASSPSSSSALGDVNEGTSSDSANINDEDIERSEFEEANTSVQDENQYEYQNDLEPDDSVSSGEASHIRENSSPSTSARLTSFSLGVLNSITNSIRSQGNGGNSNGSRTGSTTNLMSNSPTITNLNNYTTILPGASRMNSHRNNDVTLPSLSEMSEQGEINADTAPQLSSEQVERQESQSGESTGRSIEAEADKDGLFSIRLTPLIDYSSVGTGLYFAPLIRRIKPNSQVPIGRYTEKNRTAAHAPQGSSAPIVFKSKVVSRSHALFHCNEDGQWFIKDCKSSSGTFLNHMRISRASQESPLMPLLDGDVIQLGMDYRGGTEEVYRCVKMRCEFNKSWQRKVNQFNLEIHKKMKKLALGSSDGTEPDTSECAICLFKLEPCQALFISPCSHTWHYKCIRPLILKSYPQFFCPNCRSMCDLETDIEESEEES